MFLIFLTYALFASTFTLSKMALTTCSPLFVVGARMCCAGLIILPVALFREKKQLGTLLRSGKTIVGPLLGMLALLAFFNIYATNALEFSALETLSSSKVCFFYSLSPFITALFSRPLFGIQLTSMQWLGLSIGFLGISPLFLEGTEMTLLEFLFSLLIFSKAEMMILSAVCTSVLGWLLLKDIQERYQLSYLLANGISMLIGGTMALLHSRLNEPWAPLPITDGYHFALYSSMLLLISNGICYNLYGSLLCRFHPVLLSLFGNITPLFTGLYGYLFLEETFSPILCTSMAVVFCGLLLFSRAGTAIPARELSARCEAN